jgi:hypothetical protein
MSVWSIDSREKMDSRFRGDNTEDACFRRNDTKTIAGSSGNRMGAEGLNTVGYVLLNREEIVAATDAALIQPHRDDQANGDAEADEKRPHNDADSHVFVAQFFGRIKGRHFIENFVSDDHKHQRNDGAEDRVDEIQYQYGPLHVYRLLPYKFRMTTPGYRPARNVMNGIN